MATLIVGPEDLRRKKKTDDVTIHDIELINTIDYDVYVDDIDVVIYREGTTDKILKSPNTVN